MKRTALTTLILAATSLALAQQTARVTYAPVTIDGVTTSNGAVVINGKVYIAQDALTARGLTLLRPNSYGLYRFPNSQGTAVNLSTLR